MLTLTLSTFAFALDCTGLDAATCAAVNDLQASINAQAGAAVVDDAAPARLQPVTLYNKLDAVRQAASDDGCRTDDGFDGYGGGLYDLQTGAWLGSWTDGAASGLADGGVDGTAKTVFGDYDGDSTGTIGDVFGVYNRRGQTAANRDAGFAMGYWVRTTGKRGIYVELHGSCDVGVSVPDAFDPWYQGSLSGPAAPVDVTFRGTVDNVYTLFVDGVPVASDPNWPTVTTTIVPLTPGAHTLAVLGVDLGAPSMFILDASIGGSQVFTTNTSDWRSFNGSGGQPAGWQNPGFDDSGWNTPVSCGANGTSPWGSRVPGATFIWDGANCSSSGTRLFRATLMVP